MKKILFTSTALVFTAGVAAADVTVSGSANMGLKYDGTDTTVHNEVDFDVVGSGSTDSGLTFGASVDLDGSSDDSTTTTTDVSDAEVFISYEGLTLTVGEIGEANDVGGLADLGYDGIGIDDIAEINSFGSHDVHVAYGFGDWSVAASIDSAGTDEWAIGASGSFDAFSVSVGFGETAGVTQTNLTLGYSAGAIGGTVYYSDNDGVNTGMGVHLSYTSGDLTVSAAYTENDTTDGYGIGFAYDLGGATLAGAFGEAGGTETADFGISFSF